MAARSAPVSWEQAAHSVRRRLVLPDWRVWRCWSADRSTARDSPSRADWSGWLFPAANRAFCSGRSPPAAAAVRAIWIIELMAWRSGGDGSRSRSWSRQRAPGWMSAARASMLAGANASASAIASAHDVKIVSSSAVSTGRGGGPAGAWSGCMPVLNARICWTLTLENSMPSWPGRRPSKLRLTAGPAVADRRMP